ncbi:MAG: AbrB/MazE/SpoVT family DNA-binding domain-containing protein [Candidatus Saccharimonadales bacterium]
MKTITLSSKYQVVIPKELRRELDMRPGQKLRIYKAAKTGVLEISTHSELDKLYGSVKGVWSADPATDVRAQRDEWDDDTCL